MSSDEELLLQASRFRVVRVTQETERGPRHREVVRHPGAVTVLPLLDDGRVCLIRNFRPAVGRTLVELPAGTLEPNEPPRETAHRELIEETGYRAQSMAPLGEFFLSPGILDERMHLFVATGLTAGEAEREPGEIIENLVVSWDEALAMVDRGEIEDAKTIVALLQYDRRRID
ncbi:MAG: NUDIX hydrolase [Pirellulaceae bacterium]